MFQMRSEPKARRVSRIAIFAEKTKTLDQAVVDRQDVNDRARPPEQRVSAAQITGTVDVIRRGDETVEVIPWELPPRTAACFQFRARFFQGRAIDVVVAAFTELCHRPVVR